MDVVGVKSVTYLRRRLLDALYLTHRNLENFKNNSVKDKAIVDVLGMIIEVCIMFLDVYGIYNYRRGLCIACSTELGNPEPLCVGQATRKVPTLFLYNE